MDKTKETQALLDAFNGYHELTNRRIKIAAILRELVHQLKYIGITEKNILEIANELEKK